MLKKLDIRNFTLIDHLEMALYPGFSVITGETGAGKSIVIGAIGLLLGNRADAKQVKRGCDKCIIEATFDLSIYHSDVLKDFFEDNDLDYEPEECLLRREVNANGKSRAFINDTPVTLALMRELGEQLIVGFLGLDQLHKAGLRLVNEVLFLQNDAERVANVKENRLNIGGHYKVLLYKMK